MKLLPYARLMRLPNVFSAFADIFVGLSIATLYVAAYSFWNWDYLVNCFYLIAASGCLYTSGMVYNDIFDLEIDREERPYRPLPSGAVSLTFAKWLAFSLMSLGLMLATQAQYFQFGNIGTFVIAFWLAIAIFLYDFAFKYMFLGPLNMAFCRYLNMLLGFSVVRFVNEDVLNQLALTTATYILGVTYFAKQEATVSNRPTLIFASLIIVAAPLSALTIPYRFTGEIELTSLPFLIALFLVGIGTPLVRAIRNPIPANVQAAVKRCILGLIVFDAILATIFVGWAGLLIALLLIPALVLGKWVYST